MEIINFNISWMIDISFLLVIYIILPGFILSKIAIKQNNILINIGESFSFGFLIFSVFVLFGYFFQLNIRLLHFLLILTDFMLIAIYFFKKHNFVFIKLKKEVIFVLIYIAIIGFIISLFSGYYPRGDASIHFQGISSIINSNKFILPKYNLVTDNPIPDHAYDTYYYLIALISIKSGLHHSIVWHYLSPILSLILPFTLYSFLIKIIKNNTLIIFSLLIFVILSLYFPILQQGTVYDALVYPNRIYLWLLLPVSISYLIQYLKSNNNRDIIVSVLLAINLIFIHQNGFLFYLWFLGGIMVLSFILSYKKYFIKLISIIFITLIASIPFILLKFNYNKSFINASSANEWIEFYNLYKINDYLYAFPIWLKKYDLLLFFLAIILIVLIIYKCKNKKYIYLKILIVSSFFVPIFIVFNPLIVPFLSKIISFPAIGRMMRMPLYYIVFGFSIYCFYLYLYRKLKYNKIIKSIFITILLSIITFKLFTIKYDNIHHKIPKISSYIRKIVPEKSVILSDALTSSDIVSFLNYKAVIIQFNGAVDLVNSNEQKKLFSYLFGNYNGNINEIVRLLKKYNVNYIILDKNRYNLNKIITSYIKAVYKFKNFLIIKI